MTIDDTTSTDTVLSRLLLLLLLLLPLSIPSTTTLSSDLPILLKQFDSFLSISSEENIISTSVQDSDVPSTELLSDFSINDKDHIKSKCLEIINFTISTKITINDDLIQFTVRCFKILSDLLSHDEEDSLHKLQNEFILQLINCGDFKRAIEMINLIFVKIHNMNHKEQLQTPLSSKYLIQGINFNVFNSSHSKIITNLYLLLIKLVITNHQQAPKNQLLMSQQDFLSIFNVNLYNWFNAVQDPDTRTTKLNMIKKNLINYSNNCKSVFKLNFLIKAMLFDNSNDQTLLRFVQNLFQNLLKIDDKLVYQYTSKNFNELLLNLKKRKQVLNPTIIKMISNYQDLQLKYKDDFGADDINWLNYPTPDKSSRSTIEIMDLFLADTVDLDSLIGKCSSDQEWDNELKLIKLVKCTIKTVKFDNERVIELLSITFSHIISTNIVLKETKYFIDFLDYITVFIKDLKFDIRQNDLIKSLAILFKKFNKTEKYRNLSNICFLNGGKLILSNFQECLNQWMNCINYEYNILSSDLQMENFNFFKNKIDRIANLLIENGKHHESKIFLFKIFQCYCKLNSSRDFLQLERKFATDLNVSLKLLIRATISSKTLNLQNVDNELVQLLIVSCMLEKISRFNNIDGKTIIINDIIDNLKKTMKDRGLFQYLLIKYYNLIGLDSFVHVNYKEFNEKEFPMDSCMANYKELIICYNYLQYTVNRVFNQTIVVRCIDLFHRWITLKPNSMLNNNEVLLNLETSFVKLLINYLKYQSLYVYLFKILQDYLNIRSGILSQDLLFSIQKTHTSILMDLKFHKQGLTKLNNLKLLNHHNQLDIKFLEFQHHLHAQNNELSQADFNEIMKLLQKDKNYSISNNSSKLKIIENLIIYSKFSYMSSIYKYQNGDHISSVIDIRRSIRLGKMILSKYFQHLSNIEMCDLNFLKWEVSGVLIKSLNLGIKLMVHCGLTKNCLYYLDELLQFLDSQHFPVIKCYNFYKIAELYLLSKNFIKSNEFMIKSDEIYNGLEFDDNILELKGLATHCFYFQMIGDYKNEKIYYDKTDFFYKELNAGELNPVFTKLTKDDPHYLNMLQLHIAYKRFLNNKNDNSMDLQIYKRHLNPRLFNIIMAKKNTLMAKNFLNSDPLLSGLEESVMTIPSTLNSARENSIIKKLLINLSHSESLIQTTLATEWMHLKNFEIFDLNKSLINILALRSSISNSSLNNKNGDFYNADDVSRYLPFKFDKELTNKFEDSHQLIPDTEIAPFQLVSTSVFNELQRNLPENWLVVTIDICPYNGDLLLTRFEKQLDEPFILRLPLSRHCTRDVDEKMLTFNDAIKNLRDIIDESNATTKNARISQIKTRDDKLKWWEERKKLDQDLSELLNKVESSWIGGFRGIFNQSKINSNLKLEFKQKFDIILNQYLPSRFNKKFKNKIEIHDKILEILILNLSTPLETTDLLEDLIYFMLDLLLFHGEENSYDEIDIDHMYIDIEELLAKYHNENILREFNKFDHTVLIVGKECCNFPWESLPYLKKFSISRLPSLQMLNDLILKHSRDLKISKSSGSYIINPNNDLPRTELNFKQKFSQLDNWHGIVGARPTEDQFKQLLTDSNLLIYIGHGSGDQFIRSSTVKSLQKCSPSLLIGCSSGLLHDNGMLEPYGPVYNHLVAGSPMVLVNLWDVTDKDIDKFTISVFEKWGLFNNKFNKSVTQLVSLSRDECNLKYLNGAAPIVYGLPFFLRN